MVKVTDKDYYMDGFHKNNLDLAKKVITKDWDFIFVYDGYEGSGKSVKAQQDAYYCDPTIDIHRICFTAEEFHKAIVKAKKFEAVIFDEAYSGLSSRAAMSKINKTLVSVLAEIRQKNLFIFIVLPSFFDLDKYVALWRSRALIHVYTSDNFARGYFAFYNMDRKKGLYVNGKKYYTYRIPSPNFRGRFTNFSVIDDAAYREKKRKSLTKTIKEEVDKVDMLRKKLYVNIIEHPKCSELSEEDIADLMGTTYMTLYRWRKSWDESKNGDNSNEI